VTYETAHNLAHVVIALWIVVVTVLLILLVRRR
jgi:hypothetical protein